MISLGLSSIPAPARPAMAPPARRLAEPSMVEMGTTGTGIFGSGYIRELGEYNPDFSGGPFTAYRTYEKMRRGDGQVSATLMAMTTRVRCAEWAIQPPKDPTPVEKECAECVEKNLFDDIDFDRALENLLLALPFGAACHEDIWTSTNGQVRVKKLAARLPLTFYTWTVDENEDLVELVQHGFHGGSFTEFRLPADKITLYTFRQEGANFAGRAILREMFEAWFTKHGLTKVDAIACERNGMGVPSGTLGPGATKEDRERFQTFLASVAAHQGSYVMLPNGYTFDLKGVTGQVRDCSESIHRCNLEISTAALAQFMMMGQNRGGANRSLGETMSEFFYLALQTLADQVGDAFSDGTIARLAWYNYGLLPERAPRLVPQKLIALSFQVVTDALAKLGAAKLVTPDPDMELWIRQNIGAPKIDKAEIARLRQAMTTSGAANKGASAGAAGGGKQGVEESGSQGDGGGGGDGGGAENAKLGDSSGKKGAVSDQPSAISQKAAAASEITHGTGPGEPAVKTRREPGSIGSPAFRRAEMCLALSEIVGALDSGRDDVAAELRAARPRVEAEIIHRLLNVPVRKMHQASVPADAKLIGEVKGILAGVAEFGRAQIGAEQARQLAGKEPETAAKIRAADGWQDPVGLYADGVVSEFQNVLQARATNAMVQRRVRQNATPGETIQGVGADLAGQSDKWLDGIAAKGANEAFAAGRERGFAEHADEIERYIYSALLDINTCENCAAADGAEGQADEIPETPNPDCDGGDRCRCVTVAVFKGEGAAA
jgi:phage gp29-like protein